MSKKKETPTKQPVNLDKAIDEEPAHSDSPMREYLRKLIKDATKSQK